MPGNAWTTSSIPFPAVQPVAAAGMDQARAAFWSTGAAAGRPMPCAPATPSRSSLPIPLRCALLPKQSRSPSSMKITTSWPSTNPPAWSCTPAQACTPGTLVNALLHRFASLSRAAGEMRPGIVHRLDRYTSGVLLVAKNDAAHQRLAEQFAARKVEKTYLALVHGSVKQDHGRIEKPIARDPAAPRAHDRASRRGRAAWTEYRVLRRFAALRCSKCASAPAARTRFACTWAASGTPWSATASTAPRQVAGRPRRVSSSTRTASGSRSRPPANPSQSNRPCPPSLRHG